MGAELYYTIRIMLTEALYLILVFSVLLILMYISIYMILLIYSWFKGAPYVSTQDEEIKEILEAAQLQQGKTLIELGCGDGRVLRDAVSTYGVTGIGIDINPLLVFIANMRAKTIRNLTFRCSDIRTSDLSQADYIYLFLFPKLIEKLESQLQKSLTNGALIISHGFKIPYLERYLTRELQGISFKTYYYSQGVKA